MLLLGQLVDLRDAPGLAKVLLVGCESVLGHRVEGKLEGLVLGKKILMLTRIDVLNACDDGIKCALEGVLVVASKQVELVVARGGRGRQDIAQTRWWRHRNSRESRRVDWSSNERVWRRTVALGRVSAI